MPDSIGMLRGERDRSSSGVRENNLRSKRPDNLTQFYDDLGFSATAEDHDAYVEDEENYQSLIAAQQKKVDAASKEYSTYKASYDKGVSDLANAQKSLPGLEEGVTKSWNTYKKSFVPVNVIDVKGYISDNEIRASDTKVEKTYYLPKESVQSLSEGKGYSSYWNDDGGLDIWMKHNTIDYDTHGGNHETVANNTKLHTALSEGSKSIEEQFRAAATPKVAQELSSANQEFAKTAAALSESSGVLSNYKNDLDTAQSNISLSQAQRDAAWQELSDRYKSRAENMKSIFGDLNVEAAK